MPKDKLRRFGNKLDDSRANTIVLVKAARRRTTRF
jgi:hypothetical protein